MSEAPLKNPASYGWLWRSDIKQKDARVYEIPDGVLVLIPNSIPREYIVTHGKALVAKAVTQPILVLRTGIVPE